MRYLIVLLMLCLTILLPGYGLAVQPPSPPVLSRKPCQQPVTTEEEVVVGLYPLHVIVTKIDYEDAAIDFITELGTSLHVMQASAEELGQFEVGETVELCIVEALHGETEI